MLNEGILTEDPKTRIKSEMLRQIWKTGRTTPEQWERLVYSAMTGKTREDLALHDQETQVVYHRWVRSFDRLVGELVDDGYVSVEESAEGKQLVANDDLAPPDFSVAQTP